MCVNGLLYVLFSRDCILNYFYKFYYIDKNVIALYKLAYTARERGSSRMGGELAAPHTFKTFSSLRRPAEVVMCTPISANPALTALRHCALPPTMPSASDEACESTNKAKTSYAKFPLVREGQLRANSS